MERGIKSILKRKEKNKRKWIGWAAGVLLCAGSLLGGCKAEKRTEEPLRKSDFLLNTFVTITLYDQEEEPLLEESVKLCREYEQILSRTIEGSEIYALNHREAGVREMEVSSSTAELIREGLAFSEVSDGAFDVTIEPLSSLWNFSGGEKKVPEKEAILEAAGKVDYRKVSVEGNTVRFADDDTAVELGAIAKGYIADQVKDYLESRGVESGLIDLGGNILCIGSRPDGTPFKIGLQKPYFDRKETIAVLNITDQSVVTSGVYERCFEQDGVNYHHLLDPKTGYPYDNGLLSVTIVSDRSVDGDGLSTTCFSLGLEKGMELVDSLADVYGYFITEDYEVHYSRGAEELLSE